MTEVESMVAIKTHYSYQWLVTRAGLYEATIVQLFQLEITETHFGRHLHLPGEQADKTDKGVKSILKKSNILGSGDNLAK